MEIQIRLLFSALAGQSPEERERYYSAQKICDDVRAEVESLIAHDSGRGLENIVQNVIPIVFNDEED